VRRELISLFFFSPFFLFFLTYGDDDRGQSAAAAARIFFSLRRHSRERVLREDLLTQRPGVAMRGVSVPGLKPGGNVLPCNLAPLILPLQSPDSTAETDHVPPDQPCAIRQNPPTEERDAIGGPVDSALAVVQSQAQFLQSRFDPRAGAIEKRPVPME
jgi:hypothetical protein